MRVLGRSRFMMRSIAIFGFLVGIYTPLHADTLYVDSALSANCAARSYNLTSRTCGGNDGPAFTTFAAAIAAMRPGDTMAIRGGTYRMLMVVNKSGTTAAHLRFEAHAGESVIIDQGGIEIGTQRYLDFKGLTVLNSPIYGLRGTGATDVTIRDSEFAYSHHSGLTFETGARILVNNTKIHHNNNGGAWHEAITFSNVTDFEISDSEIYENNKEGIDAKYGATNGIIARNRTYRNNGPNIYIDAASNIDVYGNICHDARSANKACIGLSIESLYNPEHRPVKNVRIFNNVISGSGAGIWFWVETPDAWARFENIRIEYNTIVDNNTNTWGGILVMNGSAQNYGTGLTIKNNIIIGNSGKAFQDAPRVLPLFSIENNLYQSGETVSTLGLNSIVTATAPFLNRSGKDFHLTSGSPARGVGQSIPDVATDIEGRPRPHVNTDVGAYQFGPLPTQTSVAPPTGVRIVVTQ
jgi:Right handed beta helix region